MEIYGYVDINIYDKDDIKRPLPRYGHTMHLLNYKLYVLGEEFEEWTKDKYKKNKKKKKKKRTKKTKITI